MQLLATLNHGNQEKLEQSLKVAELAPISDLFLMAEPKHIRLLQLLLVANHVWAPDSSQHRGCTLFLKKGKRK